MCFLHQSPLTLICLSWEGKKRQRKRQIWREADLRQTLPRDKLTSNSSIFTSRAMSTRDLELVPLYKPHWWPLPLSQSVSNSVTHMNHTLTNQQKVCIRAAGCGFFISAFSSHSVDCLFVWGSFDKSEHIAMRVWSTAKYFSSVCSQASCKYVKVWIRIRLGASKSIKTGSFFCALHMDTGGTEGFS